MFFVLDSGSEAGMTAIRPFYGCFVKVYRCKRGFSVSAGKWIGAGTGGNLWLWKRKMVDKNEPMY